MRLGARTAFLIALLAFAGTACSGGGATPDDDVLAELGDDVEITDPSGPLFEGEGSDSDEGGAGSSLCEQYAMEIEQLDAQRAALLVERGTKQAERESSCVPRACDLDESCRLYVDRVEREVRPALERCRERLREKIAKRDDLRKAEEGMRTIIESALRSGSDRLTMNCGSGFCLPSGSAWRESYWKVEGASHVYWRAQQACLREVGVARAEYEESFVLPEATAVVVPELPAPPEGGTIEIAVDPGTDDAVAASEAVVTVDDGGACPEVAQRRAALRSEVEALRAEVARIEARTAQCEETFRRECSRGAMVCDDYQRWLQSAVRRKAMCDEAFDRVSDEAGAIEELYSAWSLKGTGMQTLRDAVGTCKRLADRTEALIEERLIWLPSVEEATRVSGALGDAEANAPLRNIFCDEGEVIVGLRALVHSDDIRALVPICQSWRSGSGLTGGALPVAGLPEKEGGTVSLHCPEGYALQRIFGSCSHGRIGSIAARCVRVDELGIVRVGRPGEDDPDDIPVEELLTNAAAYDLGDSVPETVLINNSAEGLGTLGSYWDETLLGGMPHDPLDYTSVVEAMEGVGCHGNGVMRGIAVRADGWLRSVGLFCDSFARGEQARSKRYWKQDAIDTSVDPTKARGPEEGIYNGFQYQETTFFVGKESVDGMTSEDEGITAESYAARLEEDLGVGTLVMSGVRLSYHDNRLDFIKPVFSRLRHLALSGPRSGFVPGDADGINTDAGTRDKTDQLQCPRGYAVTGMASTEGRRMVALRCTPVVDGGRVAREMNIWVRRRSKRTATPNEWQYQLILCDGEQGVATGLVGRSKRKVVRMELECRALPTADEPVSDAGWEFTPELFHDIVSIEAD